MSPKKRNAIYDGGEQKNTISKKTYNAIIGGIILYGIVIIALVMFLFEAYIEIMSSTVTDILFTVFMLAGGCMAYILKNPILNLIGFTLEVLGTGIFLSYLFSLGLESTILSIIITGSITVLMVLVSFFSPSLFHRRMPALGTGVIFAIVGNTIATALGYRGDLFSWVFIAIISAYIGYDFYKAQKFDKTIINAIKAALDLYLNAFLLFTMIFKLFSKKGKK